MAPIVIDGNKISSSIKSWVAAEVSELRRNHSIVPGLAVVLVGENSASKAYVRMKGRACEQVGIFSQQYNLSVDSSESDLLRLIERLNADDRIHGILVQMPLPEHIDDNRIINAILPEKDVDGFHPVNVGKLLIGQECFRPCTPYGIIKLLEQSGITIAGKEVVIVGRSNIVGKPLAAMLMQKNASGNATVTVCHSHTTNLASVTSRADILIAAIGKPKMITADMVKEGAVVIDVGINRVEDVSTGKYQLIGDVDFAAVAPKCSAISPVPGGVGPMTIAMLMHNTLQAARMSLGRQQPFPSHGPIL